jgi:hypothetical protein
MRIDQPDEFQTIGDDLGVPVNGPRLAHFRRTLNNLLAWSVR